MALTDKLIDIADAIRNKTETTEPMTLDEMPSKIESIETEPILQDKSIEITENGTTNIVADEGYDGLNNVDVTVNVESTGSGTVSTERIIDFSSLSKTNVSVKQDGTTATYGGWYLYNYIALDDYEEIKYSNVHCFYSSDNGLYLYGIIFYDANKNFISGIGLNEADNSIHSNTIASSQGGNGYLIDGTATIPSNAVYMRTTYTNVSDVIFIPNISLIKKESSGVVNILDNTDWELGGWRVNNKTLIAEESDGIYRFNKTISVSGGETLYLSKGLCCYFNTTQDDANFTGDLVITVPAGATQMGVRTFAKDFDTFNPSDYIISRTPIEEEETAANEVYSTTEVKTNKTWIDDKPIYRKVFTTNFPEITHDYSTYTSKSIDVGDLNVETCVDIDGIIVQTSNNARWTLNWYNHVAGASVITNIGNSASTINIRTNCNWLSECPIIGIFEYTKKD